MKDVRVRETPGHSTAQVGFLGGSQSSEDIDNLFLREKQVKEVFNEGLPPKSDACRRTCSDPCHLSDHPQQDAYVLQRQVGSETHL